MSTCTLNLETSRMHAILTQYEVYHRDGYRIPVRFHIQTHVCNVVLPPPPFFFKEKRRKKLFSRFGAP